MPAERCTTVGDGSRFIFWGRRWCSAACYAGFQFARGFGDFFGDFAEEYRSAAFGFGSDFLLEVLAQASEFFIQAAADFFEFVHSFCAPDSQGAIPVL
jgi:hypothetical protein